MLGSDVLASLVDSPRAPDPEALLGKFVAQAEAERGFLLWKDRVWAVDVDGFGLGHGAARLPEQAFSGVPNQVSRISEPGSLISGELQNSAGRFGLVLEHRFQTGGFQHISDRQILDWALIAAVALRWAAAAGAPPSPLAALAAKHSEASPIAEPDSVEFRESRAALEQNNWNISRAARALGMTRHGLKKRIARLRLVAPSHD